MRLLAATSTMGGTPLDIDGTGLTDPHCMKIIVATVIRTCVPRRRVILSHSVVVLFPHIVGNRHGTQGIAVEGGDALEDGGTTFRQVVRLFRCQLLALFSVPPGLSFN